MSCPGHLWVFSPLVFNNSACHFSHLPSELCKTEMNKLTFQVSSRQVRTDNNLQIMSVLLQFKWRKCKLSTAAQDQDQYTRFGVGKELVKTPQNFCTILNRDFSWLGICLIAANSWLFFRTSTKSVQITSGCFFFNVNLFQGKRVQSFLVCYFANITHLKYDLKIIKCYDLHCY